MARSRKPGVTVPRDPAKAVQWALKLDRISQNLQRAIRTLNAMSTESESLELRVASGGLSAAQNTIATHIYVLQRHIAQDPSMENLYRLALSNRRRR